MIGTEHAPLESTCSVCGSTDVAVLIEILQVPVHCNVLWPTPAQALQVPRGDMRLGFCRACGHIFNLAFNPALMEYSQAYENSLHFSPHFQRYAESLAVRLVERYDLHGKDIIEIGCGKGDFLILLCQLGDNRGVGFDRSYVPDPDTNMVTGQVTFVQDFYSERYADCRADLICCRHVLEHIQSPRDFVRSVRRSIGHRTDTVVFFEVPNAVFTLRDLGIWDLIYEHCSYFSPSSLAHLFAVCGFDVCDLAETYAGQFLCLEAVPREGIPDLTAGPCGDLEGMSADVAAFADQYRRKVETWERRLERMAQAGRRMVVWGAGSKGVSFLNTLKIREQVEYVVDINPRKHGMYVAGTGQGIVPPEFLRDYRPEVIVVMNAVYETEIRRLVESLGLVPEILCA